MNNKVNRICFNCSIKYFIHCQLNTSFLAVNAISFHLNANVKTYIHACRYICMCACRQLVINLCTCISQQTKKKSRKSTKKRQTVKIFIKFGKRTKIMCEYRHKIVRESFSLENCATQT